MNTTALDRQMGDVLWIVNCALRSAYSVRQALGRLATPNPIPRPAAYAGT
jgi:hypothetical protein